MIETKLVLIQLLIELIPNVNINSIIWVIVHSNALGEYVPSDMDLLLVGVTEE